MTAHTFSFEDTLYRGRNEREFDVTVTYSVDDRDVRVISVKHEGAEFNTTGEEGKVLLDHACDRADEDLAEHAAEAAEYAGELRRDDRLFASGARAAAKQAPARRAA